MTMPSELRFAGVLAHHHRRLILVREEHPRWGGEFWNIPSGVVEAHETPAEGAVPELREETGLEVAPDNLRLQPTSSVVVDGTSVRAWNFAVDVVEEAVSAVRDPDNLIQEARWFPLEEAVELLCALPYRPLSEPVVAMLTEQPRREPTGPSLGRNRAQSSPPRSSTDHCLP